MLLARACPDKQEKRSERVARRVEIGARAQPFGSVSPFLLLDLAQDGIGDVLRGAPIAIGVITGARRIRALARDGFALRENLSGRRSQHP